MAVPEGKLEELQEAVKALKQRIEKRSEQRDEKIDREIEKINDHIDELEGKVVDMDKVKEKLASKRLPFAANGDDIDPEKAEQKRKEYKAFMGYTRKGSDVGADELKQLTVADDESGGYTVPEDFREELMRALPDQSVMRSACRIITTGRNRIRVPKLTGSMEWYWTDEENLPNKSSDDQFGQLVVNTHTAEGLITVSRNLLEDSMFNLEEFIQEEFADSLALEEDEVFLDGSGEGQPEGILNNDEFVKNQIIKTESDGTLAYDDILDLLYEIEDKYASNGTILARRKIVREMRKMKDNEDRYLWEAPSGEGEPATFDGKPILQPSSGLDDSVESGNTVLLFGDFRFYWIVDRVNMSMQRFVEKYAPLIGLLFRVRRGGKLMLPEAFSGLEIA